MENNSCLQTGKICTAQQRFGHLPSVEYSALFTYLNDLPDLQMCLLTKSCFSHSIHLPGSDIDQSVKQTFKNVFLSYSSKKKTDDFIIYKYYLLIQENNSKKIVNSTGLGKIERLCELVKGRQDRQSQSCYLPDQSD